MNLFDRVGLRSHPHADAHRNIASAALCAVEPEALIANRLAVDGRAVTIDGVRIGEVDRVWIVSIGKAAVPMARAVEKTLGVDRIAGGIAVTRQGHGGVTDVVRVIEASHPVPDGTTGADAVEELAARVAPDDLVLCLLSGGGSALLASPPPGVSPEQLGELTELLLRSAVPIDAMNVVRRHVSRLLGGRLAALLHPASVVTLILSDVIGDRLESIASGPTVPDPTTFADAEAVLRRYGLWEAVPDAVRDHIRSGVASRIPDTPKPGDPVFDTARAFLLANNGTAVRAAAAEARDLGFDVHIHANPLCGEARDAGCAMVHEALRLASGASRAWILIAGGETTVTVRGNGRGGRNQEAALAAAIELEGIRGVSMLTLATDGSDGNTDAAGALVDGETIRRAREAGTDPHVGLSRNDSSTVLNAAGDLLRTGPTGTNVADVWWLLGDPQA